MYRFYITEQQRTGQEITITGGDVNHIRNVLRLEAGDWVTACDGAGTDYVSRIAAVERDQVRLTIEKTQATGTELPVKITLFQGIPKQEKMEFIIQKAVELGVFEIVPVLTKRCVVRFPDREKKEKKQKRWQAIAEAAAKQCDRGLVPKVCLPVTLEEAFDSAKNLEYNLIPYELSEGIDKARCAVAKACEKKSLGIFIGPEGGFEKEEIDVAISYGIEPITLGKRILRTETAGMALLSILMFQMQD